MSSIAVEILEKAAQGDLGAFEEIYKAFSGFVYNVAFRVTRNNADAQEVAQDVFMKIYRSLKDFQARSAFKTWVYRITLNTAINHYRKSARDGKNRVDYDSVVESLPGSGSTDENIIQEDNKIRLSALLAELSLEYKTCLILREIEGLSYQEISRSLNIPVNTVRSRLKRARQALLEKAKKGVGKDALSGNTRAA